MNRIIILFVVLLSALTMQAQRSSYIWYFGRNAGLDFNNTQSATSSTSQIINDVPTHLTGPIYTNEGCFTYSDRITGQVLISSDGMNVYNKNNVLMPNGTGLRGNPSSTSSGIIVPYPGKKNTFLIFTVSATTEGNKYGINYSVVDMLLDSGLGDVVASQKNINLPLNSSGYNNADAAENISAVQHANGVDYWLLTRFRDVILVWEITSSGISSTPSIYKTSHKIGVHPYPIGGGIGYLKFNSDGSKFIHVDHSAYNRSWFTIADFNRTTGVVSNIKERDIENEYGAAYALEFSNNSEYLYVATIESTPAKNGLYVSKMSDIENLSQTPIPATKLNDVISCIQMGADRRIYGIANGLRNLYIIANPDEGDTQVSILTNYLNTGTMGRLGLPVFAISFFKTLPIMAKDPICVGISNTYRITISLSGIARLVDLTWDFDDGTVITQNIPSGSSSTSTFHYTHTYTTNGTYTLTVSPSIDDGDGQIYTDPDKISKRIITVSDCSVITNPMIRTNIIKEKQ